MSVVNNSNQRAQPQCARAMILSTPKALAILVLLVLVMTYRPADAASLGGLVPQNLTAVTTPAATGASTVIAWENFNGANGTNLNGTVTDGGTKTWAVNPAGGSWTIQSNRARSTRANSSLVVNAGVFTHSVEATLLRNGATTFDAGLTINRNASGNRFLTVEWTSTSNGSLELWRFNGSWTQVGGVTNLYPGGIATAPASIVLRLTSSATALSASINGVVVASYTFTAADITNFKVATQQLAGPYQWTSNGIGFEDLHVDNP